ncbi:NADH dehydrogenase subunit E [Jannaschia seosinensis]|uniref:NADH dehydrogenase subunit E n=1 Tax=Jannaschia seosinensis TaxID=313367 RepID=A0A0M7B6C8_9RHOB|nr:hypothetical protein [Jannaschia seosinensis]CUH32614.1 NADH dehydrogenase subunit E [Jannaschia seosinensis]
MADFAETAHRNRWAYAGGGGAVAFILFLLIGWGFFWSLLGGIVIFALLLLLIGMIGSDGQDSDRSKPVERPASATDGARTSGSTVPPTVAGGGAAAGGGATGATSQAMTGTPVGEGPASDKAPPAALADDIPDATRGPDDPVAPETRAVAPDDALRGTGAPVTPTSPTSIRAADAARDASATDATHTPYGGNDDTGLPASDAEMIRAAESGEGEKRASDSELSEPATRTAAGDRATPAGDPVAPAAETVTDGPGQKPVTLDAPRNGQADDLKRIKGIGPKLETECNELGIWHFDQIANWSEDEVAWVDRHLEGFKGRVSRDDWVAQARALASGDDTNAAGQGDDRNLH